ncbi:hypothetical protein HYS93_04285 [Candidatus Daviesbacteria bacterium]|nr:hypothetical protein [Candidatus Daviesbacteria bacterium]
MNRQQLSPIAENLIGIFIKERPFEFEKRISVDPVVARFASFYEKLRNAMEYQDEEVILRSAIERILKRRLILDSRGEMVAEPLVRELAWARYFPDNTIPESFIDKISTKINLYIKLSQEVPKKYRINREKVYNWLVQALSTDINFILNPDLDTQLMCNFTFHILKKKVDMPEETEEAKDALVFINVRRAFAKEDLGFLRYHLFNQYFGELTEKTYQRILEEFPKGYEKIEQTFRHPLNSRIYSFLKKQAIPFIILKDLIRKSKDKVYDIVENTENLGALVMKICDLRYKQIYQKVQTALIRSVIFLFATKALFGLLVEGSYERLVLGGIDWRSIFLNTLTPPFLMVLAIFFIKTPDRNNSLKILTRINSILFDPNVSVVESKSFQTRSRWHPILYAIFILLWLSSLFIGIYSVNYLLNLFKVNLVSKSVFIFFLIIVSFLAFRINQSASIYSVVVERRGIRSVLFDFFFMPFIYLGRRLTLSFSKINVLLFEQWFSFLRSRREELG